MKPPFEQKALLDTGPITNHVNFVNNRKGKIAYATVGGTNEVKAFRRGATPALVSTIPVGNLPHGIWPSGNGSRVYVALEPVPYIGISSSRLSIPPVVQRTIRKQSSLEGVHTAFA